jgi:hypothetical protein
MSINLTTTLAPSGAFCAMTQINAPGSYAPGGSDAAGVGDNYLIYNPGVLQYHRGSYTTEQIDTKAAELITKSKESPLIEKAELDVYGQTCIQLAKDLASVGGHLRLGPLRGAARPCLLMDVMASGSGDFTFFNFKEGSNGNNRNRVKEELLPILRACDPHEPVYRIQVVDTAVGGQGINALTRCLWALKDQTPQFRKQKWELDYRLIHANDSRTDVGNIERAKSRARAGVFEIQMQRYVVPDLMVEDYEGALGMDLVNEHGKFLIKQSYKPGRFVLKGDDGLRLVRSDALTVTFDELFSQSITDEMLHASDLKQVGVVWQDYELKG